MLARLVPIVFLIAACAAPLRAQLTWEETLRLEPPNAATKEEFGSGVDIDGDRMIVGARNDKGIVNSRGAAYVYVRSGQSWVLEDVLLPPLPSTAFFGTEVAIDGDRAIVGAPSLSAFIFHRTGSTWALEATLDSGGASGFGRGVALQGDTAMVSGRLYSVGGGEVQVFTRTGSTWNRTDILVGSQVSGNQNLARFGDRIAIDGDTAAIGAPYQWTNGVDGNPGEVYVFERSAGVWIETQRLTPSDPDVERFHSVALEGDVLVVGAPAGDPPTASKSCAFVFERAGGLWQEAAQLLASSAPLERVGSSVGVGNGIVFIGAPEVFNPGGSRGEVLAFERNGPSWTLKEQLLPQDSRTYGFGELAVNRGTLLVGAPFSLAGQSTPQFDSVEALALDPLTGILYGADTGLDQLITIDPATGLGTTVGWLGFDKVEGLTFDENGVLFGVDSDSDQLLTIDPATAACTVVGPLNHDNVRSLTYRASTGDLYGVDTAADVLLTIDPSTGASATVGPVSHDTIQGLSFDPLTTGKLYGCDESSTNLVKINPQTGVSTSIGFLGAAVDPFGLTWDPGNANLFLTNKAPGILYTADPVTGMGTSIGWYSATQFDSGVASVFEPQFEQSYCTAGTSASGCQAGLSAFGYPSASLSEGFAVTGAGAEGQKDGLIFFGSNGRQANPWGNGTSFQCVQPPVQRTGLLTGAGTVGLCDGLFTKDLNAHWCPTCPNPGQNPGAGTAVQAQLWLRDPGNTSNQTTSLSDAIEFTLAP